METNEQIGEVSALVVDPSPVEVVVNEDGVSPLSFVMPPYDDLAEIEALKGRNFSLRRSGLLAQTSLIETFREEHARLVQKRHKFDRSPTFLNRLANLSAMVGELDDEAGYLSEALELGTDQFLSNRMIENLLARKLTHEAEVRLLQRDLRSDLYGNLRLASLAAIRGEIESALEHVNVALEIDPLSYGARLFEGALRLWRGEYEKAISSFRVASERRPNSAALYTNLAVAYIRLNQAEKALQSLKMAASIDPLSVNAVSFLADVAHALHRDEDAVPSLRYLVQFEQGNASIWARLGRGLLQIGEVGEAIAAIKRQASVEEDSNVWNNLGVAYHRKSDSHRAAACFKHAMEIGSRASNRDDGYAIAAVNLAIVLAQSKPPKEVLSFVDVLFRDLDVEQLLRRTELTGIFQVKLRALIRSRRMLEAIDFAEEVLERSLVGSELKLSMAIDLLTMHALQGGESSRALEIAEQFSDYALHSDFKSKEVRAKLLNNIAFVFAEFGKMEKAQVHLQAISSEIHKNPYPTATAGLLQLRKGDRESAQRLYAEALSLASRPTDKSRIRQKWNLEMGKTLLHEDARKATRFLTRATSERDGEDGLARQALELLKQLR
jgi:tetratricopeptide (TPR) repeat protein